MGRKLDALLGRKFKTIKFKATVNLAISRLTVLKIQRQARLTVANSDIIQLLNLNHHEHALLRVDQVIKDQNMLDVYVMVDGYCRLLLQMVNLIEQEKDCPDELKEAASSLLYAAPRCGEFPELQEIRAILTARYGKEFAYGAIELRNNCGVSTRMIQKLSPRQSTLEIRMKILQEIADENDIVLKLDDSSLVLEEVKKLEKSEPTISEIENKSNVLGDEFEEVMSFSESRKGKKKFRDVEHAAQAAFESAAYAAAAARAAVELSRSGSFGSDNPESPNSRPRKVLDSKPEKMNQQMRYEKNHESGYESQPEPEHEVTNGYDFDGYKPLKNPVVFDESENEIENEDIGFSSSRNYDEGLNAKKLDLGVENIDPGFSEGLKMQTGVQQLDLTKRPISVRTKGVYGQ